VLARLEAEPGVESAEVDRRGELLHVRIGSASDVSRVIDLLQELGFAAEVMPDAEIGAEDWYGPDRVGELSEEEAHVIATRVVPRLAEEGHIGAAEVEDLSQTVATALHAWFLSRDPAASGSAEASRSACGRVVEEAARARLGKERAAVLGRAVEADLASRSAFKG
jgi:hypothetical protein